MLKTPEVAQNDSLIGIPPNANGHFVFSHHLRRTRFSASPLEPERFKGYVTC